MPHVTLIMTRTPLQEFHFGHRSGRWGNMMMIEGPRVFGVLMSPLAQTAAVAGTAVSKGVLTAMMPFAPAHLDLGVEPLSLGGKTLSMVTDGSKVTQTTEFDTMERFRADNGRGFYMQTRPQPQKPYKLSMFVSSTVARLNTSGQCLKVHDHGYVQQGTGGEAGILVHEAPHVGWLIGCISPRLPNNRVTNSQDVTPSRQAINAIFNAMGGFASGKEASLIVLDW